MQARIPVRSLHLLSAAALVGACAHPVTQWGKPGATPEQVRQDQAECKYQVDLAGPAQHDHTVVYGKKHNPVASQQVGQAIGDGIADAERKIELMNECMTVRGYREVK